jgi:hypothetical protein
LPIALENFTFRWRWKMVGNGRTEVAPKGIGERQHAGVFPHGYGWESKAKTGGFMAEMKPRLIRVDDYVAEILEGDADRLPPSMKEQAEIYRQTAQRLCQSNNPRMVRIWEEPPGKEGGDFISPDPASH